MTTTNNIFKKAKTFFAYILAFIISPQAVADAVNTSENEYILDNKIGDIIFKK